jgi:hypothetical protein
MSAYLRVAGAIFGIYAVFHLLRVMLGWPAHVSTLAIPTWASALGLLLNGALCVWAFRLRAKLRSGT